MKTSVILAILAAFSTASVLAAPVDVDIRDIDVEEDFERDFGQNSELEKRANLPGLNSVQTKNARAIITEVKKEKLGVHGCQTAITTALTESAIKILANKKVPSSLKYAHDGVGSDHDSVGIFQQRAIYYKNISCDMKAACSAGLFFKEMKRVKGYKTMNVPKLCQKVQRSAVPAAYQKHFAAAVKICKAGM